jgi:chromosome partitioning protein
MAEEKPSLSDKPREGYARGVTVWNDSGGVGKTTIGVNSASTIGRNNRAVLAIDIDPQAGGLTHHTGFERVMSHPKYKLADVLINPERSLNELIIAGEDHNVDYDVIPAHSSLGDFGTSITNNINPVEDTPETLLRDALIEAGIHEQYDVIIVDAPATRGLLVSNAIAATRNVLIPTELTAKGVASVEGLVSYVQELQRELRREMDTPDLTLNTIGVVPNNCAKNGRLANGEKTALATLLREEYPITPFYIPSRQVLADAWEKRDSIYEYAERDTVRDLRENEQSLPHMFEMISMVIEAATIDSLTGYEGNFPQLTEVA